MLAKIAAADSASTVIKKYSVFIYSEAEPNALYAIYKQTHTFHVCFTVMDGLPGDILRLLDIVGEEGHPLDHHLLTGEQVVHVHHQAIQDYVTVTRRRKV